MRWDSMLEDGIDGSLSSRRVVTFIAFALCATAFIANLFFDMKIDQFIFDSMSYIAMVGLGATVAEKFSNSETVRTKQTKPPENYYEDYQPRNNNNYRRKTPKQHDPLL